MNLYDELRQIIDDYSRRKAGNRVSEISIHAPACWDIELGFRVAEEGVFHLRNLREGDLDKLLTFGEQLGTTAKHFFCPYPWGDEECLRASFRNAIAQSVGRVAASYLLEYDDLPIGHFFLWAAGGNAHSRAHGIELPELGVALADAFCGRGLGGLAVHLLQAVARSLDADGIELTTAVNNDAGWQTYQRAGFAYTGLLRIPLEVDVTAAAAGTLSADRYREERQMVYIIHPDKSEAILRYLALKRDESGNGGHP